MGMAASQVRLLALTSRKHDNELQTMRLSNKKVALQRDMRNITSDYQNALNTKVFKWTNNSGVSSVDLSYNNLMSPSAANQYTPYMITSESGRVVVDDKYQKYAEMISESGAPNGDWASVRTQVLSELTGVDASVIEGYESSSKSIIESKSTLDTLSKKKPSLDRFERSSLPTLLGKMGNGTGVSNLKFSKGSTYAEAYSKGGTITIGSGANAKSNLTSIFNNIKNTLGKYFVDDKDKFEKAVDSKKDEYHNFIENGTDLSNSAGMLKGTSSEYKLDVKTMIDEILAEYATKGGATGVNAHSGDDTYLWYDVDSDSYKDWQIENENWQKAYDAAESQYANSLNAKSEALTADQERQIQFYDAIFSTIAEKGWTHNSSVSDTGYLNQMLQNNTYTLTTVDRTQTYDTQKKEFTWDNDYDTDIASNNSHVVSVRDNDVANDAQIEYERKKSIINEKESAIDLRLQDLQTELSAINQMIQGVESVRDDNIERTFGIFG